MGKQGRVSFGSLIVAFLCPPLYFFLQGRVVAGLIHVCTYLVAIATLIFGIGIFFWALGFVHAYWNLAHRMREQMIERQATVIAEKMAGRMVVVR